MEARAGEEWDDYGYDETYRLIRRREIRTNKHRQEKQGYNMGMGPRKKDNDVRDSQSKCVEPANVGVGVKEKKGTGASEKQYHHSAKKYTGPNYKQPITGVSTKGGLK